MNTNLPAIYYCLITITSQVSLPLKDINGQMQQSQQTMMKKMYVHGSEVIRMFKLIVWLMIKIRLSGLMHFTITIMCTSINRNEFQNCEDNLDGKIFTIYVLINVDIDLRYDLVLQADGVSK